MSHCGVSIEMTAVFFMSECNMTVVIVCGVFQELLVFCFWGHVYLLLADCLTLCVRAQMFASI